MRAPYTAATHAAIPVTTYDGGTQHTLGVTIGLATVNFPAVLGVGSAAVKKWLKIGAALLLLAWAPFVYPS